MDFPDAPLFPVSKLVDALGPYRVASVATEHGERPPTAFGRLTARIEMHDRLDIHVVVQTAVAQAHLAELHSAHV
jgi:hypothetical protein